MNILLVTQYFYPENFKSNDIAFELTKRGHHVTVLTGIPNYPEGKYYAGYGIIRNRKQYVNGVRIIRSFLFPRGKSRGLSLALNYFSWTFTASIRAFFHSLRNKYDAVIVHGTSPPTQCYPGIVVSRRQKIPLYFWVLDLWPESLASAGGIKNPYILSFFTRMMKNIYNNCDKILISSQGFRSSIEEKGNFKDKIIYFPNWAEVIFMKPCEYLLPPLPEGFKIMFAGNLGEAQDFDNILNAALLLKKEKDIHFLIVGDGRKRNSIEKFIEENRLEDTVHLLGRYPVEMMPAFFSRADCMLITLKDEIIFNKTVPAKLQAYMAAGKFIIGMLSGEGSDLIHISGCGYAVRSGDYESLAKQITECKNMPDHQLKEMGVKGKSYYLEHFEIEKCINHLCNILKA